MPAHASRRNDKPYKEQWTLHYFAYTNDVEAVKRLLSNSCYDVSVLDGDGRTALSVATCLSRVEIAQILLALGCDPCQTDCSGNTPLHEATEKSCLKMVKLLLKTGKCQMDARNSDGHTALMKAAFYDYTDILECLHKKGANLDVKDPKGRTALFYALAEGNGVSATYLIKHGCDVNIVDIDGHSVLYEAVHSPFLKSADCLLRLEEAGYDFKKDGGWLEKEKKGSIFYRIDSMYSRFLLKAGVSRKTESTTPSVGDKSIRWNIPYTFVLDSDTDISSPSPHEKRT